MIDLSEFYAAAPYSWDAGKKSDRVMAALRLLHEHHLGDSLPYRKFAALEHRGRELRHIEDFPALPVGLFKRYDLISVPPAAIVKTMTSSGTSGQAVSKVFLDKETALAQTRALATIMKEFFGGKRLPMVVLDAKMTLRDPKLFSARGAGLLGMANFGFDHFYALNDDYTLNLEGLTEFLKKHQAERILFFGFTYMIWQHFTEVLHREGVCLNIPQSILFHVGGWKKLRELSVSHETYKTRLIEVCGTVRVHNLYGMAEQTGSVYVECPEGRFHASNFSEIIVRDPLTFAVLPFRKPGVIETVSVLPWSYPGFALLTEDIGEIFGEDDCPCGLLGRHFLIHGRLPKAETRGCSDVYAVA